jgi:hypothetical protein
MHDTYVKKIILIFIVLFSEILLPASRPNTVKISRTTSDVGRPWVTAKSTTQAISLCGMFNLKVDRQLSREYFTSDATYNGSASMTLYYLCRSWQDCCRRGENRFLAIRISWISQQWVPVFEQRHFLRFHNAVKSGRTCIYFGKLFKNDVLRPL